MMDKSTTDASNNPDHQRNSVFSTRHRSTATDNSRFNMDLNTPRLDPRKNSNGINSSMFPLIGTGIKSHNTINVGNSANHELVKRHSTKDPIAVSRNPFMNMNTASAVQVVQMVDASSIPLQRR